MKTLHWITFALKIFFAKIIFCTCTYGKISISQEFFSVQKSWSCLYFISLSYWKKAIKLLVSLAFVTSSKQKKWKQFRIAGTEVWYIFRIFFNGFSKHALATNWRNSWSLRALVIQFNTLGDKNDSATETNKIGSAPK